MATQHFCQYLKNRNKGRTRHSAGRCAAAGDSRGGELVGLERLAYLADTYLTESHKPVKQIKRSSKDCSGEKLVSKPKKPTHIVSMRTQSFRRLESDVERYQTNTIAEDNNNALISATDRHTGKRDFFYIKNKKTGSLRRVYKDEQGARDYAGF